MSIKRSYLLGGAACAAALASFTFEIRHDDGAAFIDPVLMAKSLCGPNDAGLSRRAFFITAASAYARGAAAPGAEGSPGIRPETRQAISYPAGSNVDGVQDAFDEGLAYAFGFNHGPAVLAFRRAQELDPECALCHWGEAFALGSNINAPFAEDARQRAFEASRRAAELADDGTKEAALAEALLARYVDQGTDGIAEDNQAFAEAMDRAARAYPEDDFIAVVAAEANMDTQPWDYWEANGRIPKGRSGRTLELLETVLERSPDYAPAIHLYIHTTEASSDPFRAEPYADRLAGLAPDLGHLVHMPSHTYYRLGRWEKARDHNVVAVAVDEAYLEAANNEAPIYAYGYYPHNVHFAMTSSQMAGDAETALAMAKKLDAALPMEMATMAPWIQAIKAAPYYVAAQFGEPEETLALPGPDGSMPFLRAAWHYARGEALAAQGRTADAAAEADAILALGKRQEIADLDQQFMPASSIMKIAELTVRARALAVDGDMRGAIAHMEEAAATQEALPYMEPPWWYYPTEQTLAAYLLADGQAERAEKLFQKTLLRTPNNAYALYGLGETYRAMNDRRSARYADQLFRQAWLGDRRTRPEVTRL